MFPSAIPWKILSSAESVGVLTDGWNLAESPQEQGHLEGRTFTLSITFASPFSSMPVVNLGLTGFDMDRWESTRITLKAEQITENGFIARISTWDATRVYAVEFNWFAIGP